MADSERTRTSSLFNCSSRAVFLRALELRTRTARAPQFKTLCNRLPVECLFAGPKFPASSRARGCPSNPSRTFAQAESTLFLRPRREIQRRYARCRKYKCCGDSDCNPNNFLMSIITLYDIASTHPGQAWSPSTAKARYALNFKGIAHKTVFLEYSEIEPLCKKLGAKPTSQTSPQYTFPVIHDPATGTVVSDSIEIARYLDATYPNTPRLIPEGTAALHYAFTAAFEATLPPFMHYALPASLPFLNPASQDYFRQTREELFGGRRLEDVTPTGNEHTVMWKKVEDAFGQVDGWIRKNDAESKYFMGDTICYADVTVAGFLRWGRKVLGKDKWEEIMTWHDGRWANLMKEMEKYDVIF